MSILARSLARLHAELRRARSRGTPVVPGFPTPKEYERTKHIPLPEPLPLSLSLTEALQKRDSTEDIPTTPLSLEELGTLLGAAHTKKGGRSYPSGGSIYSIETYVFSFNSTPERGAYHYNPQKHRLEYVGPLPASISSQYYVSEKWNGSASLVVLTAQWENVTRSYREFGFELALMETGHLAQNMALVSAALSCNTRSLGGFHDTRVSETLDLDPQYEQPICVLITGKKN